MPSSGLALNSQGFFDVLLVSLGKTSDFAFKNYKMQAKIERNFKGFLRAFSRVYDGIRGRKYIFFFMMGYFVTRDCAD